MALYRADVRTLYNSQYFVNVLWYRDTGLVLPGTDPADMARELGEKIRDDVIAGALLQTRWVDTVAFGTRFLDVAVMRVDPLTWRREMSAPVVTPVNLDGNPLAGYAFSPESGYIINLRCGAKTLNPLDWTPRGGYVVVGPAQENATEPDGRIAAAHLNTLRSFATRLSSRLEAGILSDYFPVRVGRGKNSLGIRVRGYADVESAAVNPRIAFRRSRRPR